jgi:hypothetical protein
MPVLMYQDNQGNYQEYEIADKMSMTRIGSDPDNNDVILPTASGVASRHAVILRSQVNHLLVLVNLAGEHTRVNGRTVLSIKVLRQQDVIQLGQVSLMIWEIRVSTLTIDSPYLKQHCQYCSGNFLMGNELIICPRCASPFHLHCWLSLTICANYPCNYPVRERVLQALSPSFLKFEAVSPELLQKRATCQARTRVDQIPFQVRDQVAYCPAPSCQAVYHLQCWLALERCTQADCGFDNLKLLKHVFSTAEGSKLQTRSNDGR